MRPESDGWSDRRMGGVEIERNQPAMWKTNVRRAAVAVVMVAAVGGGIGVPVAYAGPPTSIVPKPSAKSYQCWTTGSLWWKKTVCGYR